MGEKLKDYKINIKVRLAALWTSLMFCYIYGDYFELYVPGKTQGIIAGSSMLDTPVKLLTASIVLLIPSLMIFASVLLKPSINKWLNIIVGSLMGLITLLVGLVSFSEWRIFYVIYAFVETIIAIFIVYQAWHWRKTTRG
ncbi:MAG: DUF6326 family protein [Cyclobacteriaceae bacterium]|jgi:hypothetical protein|nr:DUF6326 family protein [Cytophagales bacterium]MCZ8326986.1 DUF6326 family protein [Cyclobacteriaceae bacterium]